MERDDRAAVACFYAEMPLAMGASVLLDERVAHHAHVRRVETGDVVAITNGAGSLGRARVVRLAKREIEIAIDEVQSVAAPYAIDLFAPVADRDRMLWAAEKATELGIASWRSVRFRRSASVSPRGEGAAFGEKLRARMIAALEQSFGAWLPRLLPDTTLTELDAGSGLRLVLDVSGEPIVDLISPSDPSCAILVGPEGGIERDELARLVASGWRTASLGSSVLRFETAVTAAIAVTRAVQASQPSIGATPRGQ